MTPLYVPPDVSRRATHVFDMAAARWQATANAGLWLKPVRHDDVLGFYLGLVRFDAGTRSGLHQHQAVATSFVLDGGLTDYHGPLGLHQAGINFKGSTHDAIAYRHTRLEGPVTYPPDGAISGVHAGSRAAAVRNLAPDTAPEVNVDVDALVAQPTGVAGLQRRTIFDYAGTGSNHRMVQWTIRPETEFAFEAGALTELWVRGGMLTVNEQPAQADCFVVCEPGAAVRVRCPYGALVMAWADGPEVGPDNLFGF
jgi:hypothetical protein